MKMNIKLKRRVIPYCVMILVLCGIAGLVLAGSFLPITSKALAEEEEKLTGTLIWPVAGRVDVNFDSPAIPKVESAATCLKKYGPNDWRTWRAQYFEKRLALKDDPYRMEHSTFADVKKRGCVFNVWTGAEGQLYGMPPHSFRCLAWPGVGVERIGEQCGYGNRDVTAAVHHHGPDVNEIITMFLGNGEGYIADHWIAMVEGGDFLWTPPTVPHGMRSGGMPGGSGVPYTKGWVGTGFASPAQWELYTKFGQLVVDKSPKAEAKGWKEVYTFSGWENGGFGLLGSPSYLAMPKGAE